MPKLIATPIYGEPGIQRDGTPFMSKRFLDGEWVRFYQGTPKKMGGLTSVYSILQTQTRDFQESDAGFAERYFFHMNQQPVGSFINILTFTNPLDNKSTMTACVVSNSSEYLKNDRVSVDEVRAVGAAGRGINYQDTPIFYPIEVFNLGVKVEVKTDPVTNPDTQETKSVPKLIYSDASDSDDRDTRERGSFFNRKGGCWFGSSLVFTGTKGPLFTSEVNKRYPNPLFVFTCCQPRYVDDVQVIPTLSNTQPSLVYYCSVDTVGLSPESGDIKGDRLIARPIYDSYMKEYITSTHGVFLMQPGYMFVLKGNGAVVMNNRFQRAEYIVAPKPTKSGDPAEGEITAVKYVPVDPLLSWSAEGISNTAEWNDFVIASTDVVKGMNVLGATPSSYFWSLNTVIKCIIDTDNLPSFQTIAENTSILSAESVVDVDGQFYWIGFGTFYQLSSSVTVLLNDTNRDWFFNNVNYTYAPLIFGVVNKRYNEIWWHFPKGTSTTCNHILIYNYVTQVWWDTPTPLYIDHATCGLTNLYTDGPLIACKTLQKIETPFDKTIVPHEEERYTPSKIEKDIEISTLCLFESDVNYTDARGNMFPIYSSIQYPYTTLYAQSTSVSESWMEASRIEIDAFVTGSFLFQLRALVFPRDHYFNVWKEPYFKVDINQDRINELAGFYNITPLVRYVDFAIQGRLLSLKIYSNQVDADFHIGNMILNWKQGSGNSGTKYIENPVSTEDRENFLT